MRRCSTHAVAAQIVVALMMFMAIAPLQAGTAVAQSGDGLTGDRSYESPQFGYEVIWDDPWSADERATRTRTDREDRLVLVDDDNGAELMVRGLVTTDSARDVLDSVIADRQDSEEDIAVEDQTRRSALLSYTTSDGDVVEYVEVSSIDTDQSVLIIDLVTPAGDFTYAMDAVASVELDGDSLFRDEPTVSGSTNGSDSTATPTDEGTVRRRPDFSTGTATEAPTTTADQEGVDGNTFTSPNFDFSISWDEDVWTVEETSIDQTNDQISLDSSDSYIVFQAGNSFGGDVDACLSAITDTLAEGTDEVEITDFEVLDDENGDPIEDSSRGSAYVANLYTATYQGSEEQFVYYVECRPLVEGESELVIFQFVANAGDYTDQADARDEVIQSLTRAGGSNTSRTPTPDDNEPTATPKNDTGTSSGDSTTYSSDAFGFSLSYDPEVWEESGSGDDGIALDDGPSSLTIAAAEDFDGDSVTCVQGQLDQLRGIDGVTRVEAEPGDNGRRISGGDSERFYALYRVTATDGTFEGTNDVLVYLECRTLEEGTSVISVTQIVFNPDQYEQESAKATSVLDTIEIGG